MRARQTVAGLTACAIGGTYVVHLGLNVDETLLAGTRGFGIERFDITDPTQPRRDGWLLGMRHFADDTTGFDPRRFAYETGSQPIQAFRWGDYTVKPGRAYRYRVVLLEGDPGALQEKLSVAVEIATESEAGGPHNVYFNRGVAASQAYFHKFHNQSPAQAGPAAFVWLSRGLEEALLQFIADAHGPGFGLRTAFYEFTNVRVLDALGAAAARGADVELIVDEQPDAEGQQNLAAIARQGLGPLVHPRIAAKIPHNKFMILMRDGAPIEVWTGSTNISDGGIFGHSNVGHRVRDAALAELYLSYWTQLKDDPQPTPLRDAVEALSKVPTNAPDAGITALFSPRHGTRALQWYAERLDAAADLVILTCPFGVTKTMEDALNTPTSSLRYVLLDKEDSGIEVMKRDPSNSFSVGARLPAKSLTGWAAESLTGFNHAVLYVHTKYLLLDPLGDDPIVISGSANWSDPSVNANDENMLVIRGDKRVADIYLTDFMRLFDHFESRWQIIKKQTAGAKFVEAPVELVGGQGGAAIAAVAPEANADALRLTDDWWQEHYVADSPRAREREVFSTRVSL